MRRLFALAFFAVAPTLWAQYPGSKMVPEEFAKGFGSISVEDARKWLEFLAGPECEGRGTGQDGYLKAAAFMSDKFKEFGLKPMGDKGTFFQNVPFGSVTVKGGSIKVGGVDLTVGTKLMFTSASEDASQSAPLVFINAKGAKAIAPADLKGKIVIAKLDGVGRDFRRVLQSSGATVFQVSDTIQEGRTITLRGGTTALGGRIHPDALASLLSAGGVTLPDAGDGETKVVTSSSNATVSVQVESQRKDMPNVVGMIEGSDPVLKNEYIGIGAHLDHLGKNADGVVYPGADDDGSGSTALLCVMKAMHDGGIKPKRSILFMAFTGEEMGLVGSGFLANNPPVPLDKMICELQMDMVGRNSDGIQNGDRNRVDKFEENIDTIRLVGSKRISTELDQLIQDTNQYLNFKFKYDAEDVYTRSDHYNFAAKGVPIAFLFDGFHPDYHRPTDTVDKINFDKLTNAAKLYYLVALKAANRDAAFKKDVPQNGG